MSTGGRANRCEANYAECVKYTMPHMVRVWIVGPSHNLDDILY